MMTENHLPFYMDHTGSSVCPQDIAKRKEYAKGKQFNQLPVDCHISWVYLIDIPVFLRDVYFEPFEVRHRSLTTMKRRGQAQQGSASS